MSLNIGGQELKVTLLGTGSPIPMLDRFGPSILVEAGPEKLLIDCGRGASLRLWQLHIPLGAVTAVFLTHLHSDHVVGIPDLWLTGWLPPPFGHRTQAFQIWRPIGTKEMMANLQKAFAADIRFRMADGIPAQGIAIVAQDVAQGIVYESDASRSPHSKLTMRLQNPLLAIALTIEDALSFFPAILAPVRILSVFQRTLTF